MNSSRPWCLKFVPSSLFTVLIIVWATTLLRRSDPTSSNLWDPNCDKGTAHKRRPSPTSKWTPSFQSFGQESDPHLDTVHQWNKHAVGRDHILMSTKYLMDLALKHLGIQKCGQCKQHWGSLNMISPTKIHILPQVGMSNIWQLNKQDCLYAVACTGLLSMWFCLSLPLQCILFSLLHNSDASPSQS